ncbi:MULTISPECIES: hypothetical protein [Halobacterium]|uniref:hypothetical protein n=1 Tax=Halobacterium TaxID=2239 RepID=UPI00073F3B6A|nr:MULTISPECIES: hypothetical protein [Halobacterium]MCG1003744.1 hypothetical protein [Halobacterium noricense]
MPDVSRRALLRGVTLAGAASVGGAAGVGTHAFLTDGQLFPGNDVASGSLDLQVATLVESNGEVTTTPRQDPAAFPASFAEETDVTLSFRDVDPASGPVSGSATVAFRVCDNPGRVWLRADGPASALADEVDVTLAYASTCGDASATIFEGSLTGLLDEFDGGVRLGAGGCRELGKVELHGGAFVAEETGDSLAVGDVPGSLALDGSTTLEITGVHWKDDGDEVRGVDLAADDVEFCRVNVKGGGKPTHAGGGNGASGNEPGLVTHRWDCASAATAVLAGTNPGGQPSGLSHFVVYGCTDDDGCVGCEPACLTLDWTLQTPDAAGESLSFVLELFASQCRHTDPTNPWQ